MAWVDDRLYCHTKLMKVGKPARWIYVAAITYSSGWQTHGRLEKGEQEVIGSTSKTRQELVTAGLWEDAGSGAIKIHDWDDHNDKRDERKKVDRERKRAARAAEKSAGQSAGQSQGRSQGQSTAPSTVAAHVEGSEGSKDFDSEVDLEAGLVLDLARDEGLPISQPLHNPADPVAALLHELRDADPGTELILRKLALPEYAYRQATEEIRANGRKTKLAVTILHRIRDEITAARATIAEDLATVPPGDPDADIPFD